MQEEIITLIFLVVCFNRVFSLWLLVAVTDFDLIRTISVTLNVYYVAKSHN